MSRTTGKYTTKQKIEALTLMEQDGLRATERRLGIPRQTLSKWKKDFKTIKAENEDEVTTVKELGQILVTTKEELLEAHMVEFIPKAVAFKEMALKKMQELTGKATKPEHLHMVAGAYKLVHDSITPKGSMNVNIDNSKTENNLTIAQVLETNYRDKLKK